MKKSPKRLSLRTETVRQLDATELNRARGAAMAVGCSFWESLRNGTCSTQDGNYVCTNAL